MAVGCLRAGSYGKRRPAAAREAQPSSLSLQGCNHFFPPPKKISAPVLNAHRGSQCFGFFFLNYFFLNARALGVFLLKSIPETPLVAWVGKGDAWQPGRGGGGTALELRCHTGTRRLSRFSANLHLVQLIAYLSYLLSFASLSLPQNGTRLKKYQ